MQIDILAVLKSFDYMCRIEIIWLHVDGLVSFEQLGREREQ